MSKVIVKQKMTSIPIKKICVSLIKKFNRYLWKHEDKYSEKNQSKFRRLSNTSRKYENKKVKLRSSCYNYGKEGHYRLECPMKNKDKEKGRHKKYSKPKRAYVAWERESDSSSDESSTSSVESIQIHLMENKKKKKVLSHSKHESTHDLYYSQLEEYFENLQRQAINAFKKLASNKRIFSHLKSKFWKKKRIWKLLGNLWYIF